MGGRVGKSWTMTEQVYLLAIPRRVRRRVLLSRKPLIRGREARAIAPNSSPANQGIAVTNFERKRA